MRNTFVFFDTMRRNQFIPNSDKAVRLEAELIKCQLHFKDKLGAFEPERNIDGCMTWMDTPQGQDFWSSLYAGNGFLRGV